MSKKSTIVIIVSVILAVVIAGSGFAVMFLSKDKNKSNNSETYPVTPPATTDGDIRFGGVEENDKIDFDKGADEYFDVSLTGYLERMEKGSPKIDESGNYLTDEVGDIIFEDAFDSDFEAIMDNLIMLVNRTVKEQYSMEASHQVQRFYVEYYDRFGGRNFDELFADISACIPREGADRTSLSTKACEVFGFNRGDQFAFVFKPFEIAEIKVEFYNVKPKLAEISDELKALSIYENWHNPDDEGYERNLEAWLENIIKVTTEAKLSNEKVMTAQILYAGSLVNADYITDWDKALIRCLNIEKWEYDAFKFAVEDEFHISIDDNLSLLECFQEVSE